MLKRRWTDNLPSPYDAVQWTTSPVTITDHRTGDTLYHQPAIEHPATWSRNAIDICASKYFRRADIPDIGGETSVRQLARRVANCLAGHGAQVGYFDDAESQIFRDELIAGFLLQQVGFNSPVWFNYGLYSEYGITGNGERRRYYYDSTAGEIRETRSELKRPSGAACYLSGVSDSLFTEDETGMADLLANEQKIFLTGAGDGVNISDIRATGEPINGGGKSSGLVAYLKVRDASAGYIRSGGRTRRSATLLCCELDHPDIQEFIAWKEVEEHKAHALMAAGYTSGMDGEAYATVSGQNSNNSVRVSNAFMEAVRNNDDWHLLSRVDYDKFPGSDAIKLTPAHTTPQGEIWTDPAGRPIAMKRTGESNLRKIMNTLNADDLWRQVCESAWRCGCPGIQFDDTINDWNTVPHYGRIRTTNPCAEICLPDWSVCNLGSINLLHFFDDLANPDWDGFRHAVRLMTIALDLVVDVSSYPTRKHAEGSMRIRSIGLNHGNIGSVLMRNGIAYDSYAGRLWMGLITSVMTLESWRTSLELAQKLGPYPEYRADAHRAILDKHATAAAMLSDAARRNTNGTIMPDPQLVDRLHKDWQTFCAHGDLQTHGLRNNTVTTIPPQGTIGLVLDQDTLGCEPEFCLVKHKTLSGGGQMKIVNQSVRPALTRLGYTDDQVERICEYIMHHATIEGCPELIDPAHETIFQTAICPANTLDPTVVDILKEPEDHDEAIRHIAGARTPEEAIRSLPPHLTYLRDKVKVFRGAITTEGHIKALAAIQPHLSHSISKTCNMPAHSTVDDISAAYLSAFEMGVKCVAIYRDGSKTAQPLNAGHAARTSAKSPIPAPVTQLQSTPTADGAWTPDKWPAVKRPTPHHTSNCDLFHFRIADSSGSQGLFINATLYPETDKLMAIFVNTGRQGETTNGLVHSLARVISCALQHGVPPEEIGHKLAGMTFPPQGFLGETSAFGIHRAKSISDLLGRLLIALPAYYSSGRNPDVMHPNYNAIFTSALMSETLNANGNGSITARPENARELGYTGKPCLNCGSFNTVGSADCYVCRECGQSNGPCAG